MLAVQSDELKDLLDRGARLDASGFTAEAYFVFLAAFEREPQDLQVQMRVGDFLLRRGELDDAQRLFSMAASKGDLGGLRGLVEVRERRGQLDAALALIEQVPGAIEKSLALRIVAARVLARKGRAKEACTMLTAVETGSIPDAAAAGVLYTLGDLYDGLGRPDHAFEAWKSANARRGLVFDAVSLRMEVDEAIARYPRGAFEDLPQGSPSDRPIFILGVPLSGTGHVERLLGAHPMVWGAGDLPDIDALSHGTQFDDPEQITRAADTYLTRLRNLSVTAERITNKMPFNALRLGLIVQMFPNAPLYHCRRDTEDTAISIFSRNFGDWYTYATSLSDIAAYVAEHERIMAHWRDVLPLPMLEINYAELVSGSEGMSRQIIDHAGLDWDPDVGVIRADNGSAAARFNSAVGRAEAYSKPLCAFTEALERARTCMVKGDGDVAA